MTQQEIPCWLCGRTVGYNDDIRCLRCLRCRAPRLDKIVSVKEAKRHYAYLKKAALVKRLSNARAEKW